LPRNPRSNLALENARRSGGSAALPVVAVHAIGDHLAEGAISINAQRVVTYVNRIAVGLLGIPANAAVGRDVMALLGPNADTGRRFARAVSDVLEKRAEQVLTVNDADAPSPFNVDYCRLIPIAEGGALILLGETMSPTVTEQLAKARALAGVFQLVNQSLEVERVVHLLAKHAAELLGGDSARLLMLEHDDLVTASAVGSLGTVVGSREKIGESFAGQAVETRRVARTEDLPATAGDPAHPARRVHAIAAPLQVGDRPIGAIVVTRAAERRFTGHDEQLLVSLATHGAIALENARLYRAAAQTAGHTGILAATARTLAHNATPESVYAGIARVVTDSLRADGFSIHAVDVPHQHVQLLRSHGFGAGPASDDPHVFWAARQGDTARSAAPEFVSDLDPAREPHSLESADVRSVALLPLLIEGRVGGVLTLRYRQRRPFEERERTLLSDFSTYVSVAIRNASLVGDLERRAARLSAVAKVQLAMSRTELAEVYTEVYRAVASSVSDASRFALLLADQAASTFRPQLVVVGGVVTRTGALTPVPFTECAATAALRTGQPVVSNAPVRAWDALVPGAAMAAPPASELAAPIVHGERPLGVVIVQSTHRDAFSAEDVELMSIIARQAGAAIDNARLFEAQRTEREMAEAAVRAMRAAHERERMLATALATMDQPVFVLSLDRRVLYANAAAVREYGYALDELTSMSIDELVASAVAMRPGEEIAGTAPNVVVAEHVHRRRDGSQFPAAVALDFIRQDTGAPIGHVLSVRNLTSERRIAEQLRQSEKLAALGELVAGVAHELNNPLAGISAFAQLLLEEPLDDDQRESARLIKREADRAVGVIRDLLLFSRKTGPTNAPVDLNALIELTLRLRAYSLRSSGVDIETHLDRDLPEIAGDDQKLQQVILNLIVNAEYAMRRSTTRRLVIRTAREADTAVAEVSDTGTGMSEETLQRVFEPFFTTKPPGEGTGLGLSVSYGIVEAHGGTIGVASIPGRGTTFRMMLPARGHRALGREGSV
jgi:PAS domain S-box-containing protein